MAGEATGARWLPQPSSTDDIRADFYSDMKSRPTRAMLETVLDAKTGDVQKGEDPTTNALCARVAKLLGKENAILLPSGTMCNEIALRIHCEPGSEVICERSSHILNFEAGGPAALSGIMMYPIDGEFGRFTAAQVRQAVRPESRYSPRTALISVEQTTNLGGGGIWPLTDLQEIAATGKEYGLATHMDGARIFNASVATGVAPADYAKDYDSCWIDFTKGLGGFAGAVLAGSHAFINEAWRFAQQWGGALRQSGVISATALYALDNHIDRLSEDHARAAAIGKSLQEMPNVKSVLPCETNIIIFEIVEGGPSAATVVNRLLQKGIRLGVFGERTVRIVTHLDVDDRSVELLCRELTNALAA